MIRDAALTLFAERGVDAVTVRQIATAAGVSAPLVMHHFGSKDGLREAVDAHVTAFVEQMLAEAESLAEVGGDVQLSRAMAERLQSQPDLVRYISRLLAEGGPAAAALFDRLYAATLTGLRELERAGVARGSDDDTARALFLLVNDLALLLLRPHVARVLGADPLTDAGLARWNATLLDVYTGGVFTPARKEHDQ